MLLLLERTKNNHFSLYCPAIYGSDSWGSDTQISLEKARKNWYHVYWSYRGEYSDDVLEKSKINVVLETYNIDEILKFVSKHNKKEVIKILGQYESIVQEYIKFLKWVYKSKEN